MAANSGVKMFRDFLRDSPCRMAYMMTQQKNFTQQYAKNHHHPASRPKTAPAPAPSNLAQALASHQLMPDVAMNPTRPRTSTRLTKPNLQLMSTEGLLATTSRRPPADPIRRQDAPPARIRRPSEQIRKRPSGTSVQDVPKRHRPKHSSSSKQSDRDAPKRPCKICTVPDERQKWQDLLVDTPSSSSSKTDSFQRLIGDIERIRSELTSRGDGQQAGLQRSLELINEISQRFDSIGTPAEGASYLSRLGPFQTADRRIKPRKSIRALRFEGGRIVERDYAKLRQRDGAVQHVGKSKPRQVEKRFDEGPLRMLLPFMRGSVKEGNVKF